MPEPTEYRHPETPAEEHFRVGYQPRGAPVPLDRLSVLAVLDVIREVYSPDALRAQARAFGHDARLFTKMGLPHTAAQKEAIESALHEWAHDLVQADAEPRS